MVAFVKGMTVYDPQQYWNTFFTPGLLSRFMKGERLPDIDINTVASQMPRVEITSPGPYFATEKETVAVTVKASPGGNGLGKIFLYHNGCPLEEESRSLKVQSTGGLKVFTVELLPGENRFVGAAFDRSGKAEGRSAEALVVCTPKDLRKPDLYVLSIGVSNYKERNIRLKSPVSDSVAIGEAMKTLSRDLYRNIDVKVLTDEGASRAGILNGIRSIIARAKKADTVILFLAGHGDVEKDEYYYIPYDADITDVEKTALSLKELGREMKGLNANRVALFLDTCKSGSAVKDLGRFALMERGYDEIKRIAGFARERGIAVLSAASESQKAYEVKELRHGIFTYSMLEVLGKHKKGIATDKRVTISKLIDAVDAKTRETSLKYMPVEQRPIRYTFGDNFTVDLVE